MKTNLQQYMETLLENKYLEARCPHSPTQASSNEEESRLKRWFGYFGIHSKEPDNSKTANDWLKHIQRVCEKIRDEGIENLSKADYLYFIKHQGMISEFNIYVFMTKVQSEISNEINRRLQNPSPVSSASTL